MTTKTNRIILAGGFALSVFVSACSGPPETSRKASTTDVLVSEESYEEGGWSDEEIEDAARADPCEHPNPPDYCSDE